MTAIAAQIIMIDDDREDIYAIRRALTRSHLDVEIISFSSGSTFLEWLASGDTVKPDLVFVDINMPNVNGYMVVEALRCNDDWNEIPIWMLTTSSLKADFTKCLALGANSFITKPASKVEMELFVNSLDKFFYAPEDRLLEGELVSAM